MTDEVAGELVVASRSLARLTNRWSSLEPDHQPVGIDRQQRDQIQTIGDSDRISVAITSGPNLAYPLDPAVATSTFINNPNNRAYQPRADRDEYTIPEQIWQCTGSIQQDLGANLVATAAYVGSQAEFLIGVLPRDNRSAALYGCSSPEQGSSPALRPCYVPSAVKCPDLERRLSFSCR